jgi:hypothetical protein
VGSLGSTPTRFRQLIGNKYVKHSVLFQLEHLFQLTAGRFSPCTPDESRTLDGCRFATWCARPRDAVASVVQATVQMRLLARSLVHAGTHEALRLSLPFLAPSERGVDHTSNVVTATWTCALTITQPACSRLLSKRLRATA